MRNSLRKAGLVAGLFFALSNTSHATTFGPVSIVEQAANSQYYVRGHVVGFPVSKMAPRINRPYTYWHISVTQQLYGNPLPTEMSVRQPGGEVGDMGYRVAGSAEFAGGEEVFIALHDTDENDDIKEVVGLASGKFRVEKGTDGKKVVMSGLGLPVTGGDGKILSPEDFEALLRRIATKQVTEADRNVFVSRNSTHEVEQTAEFKAREADVQKLRTSSPQVAADASKSAAVSSVSTDENRVQESVAGSEEKGTGSSATGWIIAAVLLLALLGGLAWALKR